MNSNLDELLYPSRFVSKQVRHTFLKDTDGPDSFLPVPLSSQKGISIRSISESISSRYRLDTSQSFSEAFLPGIGDGLGSNFSILGPQAAQSKINVEEHQGICAIIEINGYTKLIQSLYGTVPAQVVARSIEGVISKVFLLLSIEQRPVPQMKKIIDIIDSFHGDIVSFKNDFIVVAWRYKNKEEHFAEFWQTLDGPFDRDPNKDKRRSSYVKQSDQRKPTFSRRLSLLGHEQSQAGGILETSLGMGGTLRIPGMAQSRVSTSSLSNMGSSFIKSSAPGPQTQSRVLLNAVLCCERCIATLKPQEIWALEDYHIDVRSAKLSSRCSIGIGSIVDTHFGIKRVKMEALSGGTAFINARNLLNSNVTVGYVAIATGAYNLLKKMDIFNFTPCSSGYVLEAISRDFTDPIYSEVENVAEEVLYADDVAMDLQQNNALLEPFLCDYSAKIWKGRKDLKVINNMHKPQWDQCTVLSVRIEVSGNSSDDYTARMTETCRKAQELMCLLLKNTSANNTFLENVVSNSNDSISLNLMTFDAYADPPSVVTGMKLALLLKQASLKKKIFKGVSIGVATGKCYRGILLNKHRSAYRVLGTCFQLSGRISMSELSLNNVLIDNATIAAYTDITKSSMFSRVDILIPPYATLPSLIEQDASSCVTFEIEVPVASKDLMNFTRSFSVDFEKSPSQRRTSLDGQNKSQLYIFWKTLVKNFMDKKTQRLIIIEGQEGTGKSRSIKILKNLCSKQGMPDIEACCSENDMYGSPMYPYMIIVPRLLDLIEWNFSTKNGCDDSYGSKNSMRDSTASFQRFSATDSKDRPLDNHDLKTGRKKKVAGLRRGFSSMVLQAVSAIKKAIKRNDAKVAPEKERTVEDSDSRIVASIREALRKVGEDPEGALPLLNNVILPDIDLKNSLDGLRPEAHTNLLARLIIGMMDKLSELRPIAFLIDDVQWMASWYITYQICHRCTNVFVVLASSYTSDYRSDILSTLKSQTYSKLVDLNIENYKNAEQSLLREFFFFASNADNKIINYIQGNIGESHMHLECMAQMILDSGIFQVRYGLLEVPSLSEDLPSSLPSSLVELIKWQYVRICSKAFQKVIRCASIVGTFFSIEEICAVWPDVYPSQPRSQNSAYLKQWILGLILTQDYFDFFEPYADADEESMNPSLLSSSTFRFRYRAIKKIVHDELVSLNEKTMRHKNLILHYERQINVVTEPIYIPLIAYHYSVTCVSDRTSILKRIRYLVMLGFYLCQSTESFMEARAVFKEIQLILDKYEMHEQLGQNVSVKLHSQMALAHSNGPPDCLNLKKSLEHAKLGMKILDQPWPSTDFARRTLIFKHAGIILFNFWKLMLPQIHMEQKPTKLEKRLSQISVFQEDFASPLEDEATRSSFSVLLSSREIERLHDLDPFLAVLSEILPKTNAPLIDQIICDTWSMSTALRLNNNRKSRTRLLVSLALKLWFLGRIKTSVFLYKTASKMLYTSNGNINPRTCPVTLTLSCTFLVACGKWEMAEKQAVEGMNFCRSHGYYDGWYTCGNHRALMYAFNGRFDAALQSLQEVSLEANFNARFDETSNTLAVACVIEILKGCASQSNLTIERMEKDYETAPLFLKLLYDTIRCHLYVTSNDLEQSSRAMGRALRVLDDVTYMEGRVWYPILLLTICLFSMYDLSLKIQKPQQCSRMGTLFRSPTRDSSSRGSMRVSETTSQDLPESSSSTFEVNPNDSLNSYRYTVPFSLALIKSGSVVDQWSHPTVSSIPAAAYAFIDRSVVRQWTSLLLQKLGQLSPYSISEPCTLLAKTLYKVLWGEAQLLPVPKVGFSHSYILLEEAKVLYRRKGSQMRYIAVVMAVKAMKLAATGSETKECKDAVTAMVTEGKMESCLAIL